MEKAREFLAWHNDPRPTPVDGWDIGETKSIDEITFANTDLAAICELCEEFYKENKRLRVLLSRCVDKLRVYGEQTKHEYNGGDNAGWLIDDINKALSLQ